MTERDVAQLEALYAGRSIYQGELHDHANTGGTSDGGRTLEHWKGALEAQEMDFAAILDHRQVRHMYLPAWDNSIFIGGTEPGAEVFKPSGEKLGTIHYNMIFSDPKQLEALLEEFPEYEFTGGPEGHFGYPRFTKERLGEVIDSVKHHGGHFVFPHPSSMSYGGGKKYDSTADDWAIRDEIGIEVPYMRLDCPETEENYQIWRHLLRTGKRMWVSAGGDMHGCAHDWALTSIYAEEKTSACFIRHLRQGDYTAGPVGIRMCMGDTLMGSKCDFARQRLVVGVGKFHRSVRNPEHRYRLDVWADEEVVYSREISCEEPTYVAVDAEASKSFYRAEVYDVTRELRLALGNPIWNRAHCAKSEGGDL